jgi:hypothetical protein
MGVYLPTLGQWQEAFAASGWQCPRIRPTDSPPGGYLFELTPANFELTRATVGAELQAVH